MQPHAGCDFCSTITGSNSVYMQVDFIVAFLGVAYARAVAAPLNPNYKLVRTRIPGPAVLARMTAAPVHTELGMRHRTSSYSSWKMQSPSCCLCLQRAILLQNRLPANCLFQLPPSHSHRLLVGIPDLSIAFMCKLCFSVLDGQQLGCPEGACPSAGQLAPHFLLRQIEQVVEANQQMKQVHLHI